ncbi:MAG: sigma-54-dependent Fis family transcriptional regulator [Sandaracinus sp.]|nr:sigma-54-dependent Fis family transcriptional regulator [Sandaracinus sp.]MCB9621351.1 sigma-54-dependent Fis family transcriptional regulator [Sandaracinus sp.]MCB9632439.1 sigma-54-dependent Fis family transcriptional regulator [Sandaracinus sp.]
MAEAILIVDDDPEVLRTMGRALERRGFDVATARDGHEGIAKLREAPPDLVVVDLAMPGLGGLGMLRRMREDGIHLPTLVMSGSGSVSDAVEALQLGAQDFLEKPVRTERLLVSLERTLEAQRLREQHEALQRDVRSPRPILGESAAIRDLRNLLRRIAPAEGRVLVTGENGSGKELVAAAIHHGSPRSDGPFVQLNCSAVPRDLVESELFGHERGAFTGAHQRRKGRFELAHGGTLFLDEIGDMPLEMQAKLLRVLEESRFERVGGTRTLEVDVRVVAATHQNLAAMVERGTFREDLYYRLAVLSVHVPPLRERREDIVLLAKVFLERAARANRRELTGFAEDALDALRRHDFPGNVRELQNLCERFVILVEGPRVTLADVQRTLEPSRRGGTFELGQGGLAEIVERFERHVIESAIALHGTRAAAARALEVDRSFFYKKCKRFGIEADAGEPKRAVRDTSIAAREDDWRNA